MGLRDYSTTAADNLSVGGVSIAEGWLPASVNDSIRAALADTAKLLLDFGGGIPTTGTANAYLIDLSSAPTAYADNLLFVCKLHQAVTGPATMNVSGIGVKDFKKLVSGVATPLRNGDGPIGHRAICIYSSADNAVLMLNTYGSAIYEDAGADLTAEIYDPTTLLPDDFSVPTTGEWYNNERIASIQGSLAVVNEDAAQIAPYHGEYGGWLVPFFVRNYATTTSSDFPNTYEHPYEAEGTPKTYVRGGLVIREENDAIDLAFDRVNFDGSGNLTYPPDPTNSTVLLRAYSRMAGIDHFNYHLQTPVNIAGVDIGTGTITTIGAHGLSIDQRVVIADVSGTTQLNSSGEGYLNNGYVVRTVPGASTLTLKNLAGVATSMSGWGAWTAGGTVTPAIPHYGIHHPGSHGSRFAVIQHRYVPAADYMTSGRFSGYTEFLATYPWTTERLPGNGALQVSASFRAPEMASGHTGLWLSVWNGGSTFPSTDAREVKTKALGDLDSSDRVLYIDQAEAGVGQTIPYQQILSDNDGATLTVEQRGFTIYSPSNSTRAVFTGPASYPAGLRYRLLSGGTGGQRFTVGAGTIRQGGTTGTKIENNPMRDGDSVVVESASTAIWYVVSMVGAWTVS